MTRSNVNHKLYSLKDFRLCELAEGVIFSDDYVKCDFTDLVDSILLSYLKYGELKGKQRKALLMHMTVNFKLCAVELGK